MKVQTQSREFFSNPLQKLLRVANPEGISLNSVQEHMDCHQHASQYIEMIEITHIITSYTQKIQIQ
jgi:hypothetical protein